MRLASVLVPALSQYCCATMHFPITIHSFICELPVGHGPAIRNCAGVRIEGAIAHNLQLSKYR
jgi:hypothetical protein